MFKSNGSTKYPIICAPMNGVSDARLAIACYNAGIIPSLLPYSYDSKNRLDLEKFELELAEYTKATNFGSLLVALESIDYSNDIVFNLLVKYKISMVEVLDVRKETIRDIYASSIKAKEHNILTMLKITDDFSTVASILNRVGHFDIINVKGPNGAGRGRDGLKIEEELVKIKKEFPEVKVSVSGGISTSSDLKNLFDLGADFVSIGTLFCTSEESRLSLEAKNKIVMASSTDIQSLPGGAKQRGLIFSQIEEKDSNNTVGLLEGIKTGNTGHIFVGSAVDSIDRIKTVQEIVNELAENL